MDITGLWAGVVESLSSAKLFVHLAALLYVAGFLVRDQLVLRVLILMGTGFYMGYYFFVGDTPLWDAFIWSCIMGAANCFVIIQILMERTTFNMSEREVALYGVFNALTPGEFRKLLKITHWEKADNEITLTHENKRPENLYYVLKGESHITKKGVDFVVSRAGFIAEISYALDRVASATVNLLPGSDYVIWARDDLKTLESKNPSIRIALHAILNSDLADKVANSIGDVRASTN